MATLVTLLRQLDTLLDFLEEADHLGDVELYNGAKRGLTTLSENIQCSPITYTHERRNLKPVLTHDPSFPLPAQENQASREGLLAQVEKFVDDERYGRSVQTNLSM